MGIQHFFHYHFPYFLIRAPSYGCNRGMEKKHQKHSARQSCFFHRYCILKGMCKVLMLCAKLLQSCLILFNLMDYSPPGSYVHGIFQVRILEGLPLLSLGDLPNPGLKTCLLHLLHWQVDSLSLCYVISYLFYIE